MKRRRWRCGERRIDDAELLGEGGEAGRDRTGRRGDQTAPVKDKLVVAADGVDVGHRAAERAGGVGHEFLTDIALGEVPRAGGEVDHHVTFLRRELGEWFEAVIKAPRAEHRVGPDVFANRDADAEAGMFNNGGRRGGFEIAVLVEHIVGG